MNNFRTTFAATVASLLTGVSLAFAPAAGATALDAPPSERVRAFYGAMALSSDGAVGYAYDYRTKRAAMNAAHQRCRQRSDYPGTCTKVGWIRNACGALSVRYRSDGFVSRYKFGWGPTKRTAIRQAKRNFGGQIRGWVCTTR